MPRGSSWSSTERISLKRRIVMKQFNLEEYLKNPSRKVVTRNGRKVTRILCTDARGRYPIVALVKALDNDNESSFSYTKDGHFDPDEEHIYDLFFAPEKHEGWINLYKDDGIVYTSMNIFKTKKEAESASCRTCIATVKIEWEE